MWTKILPKVYEIRVGTKINNIFYITKRLLYDSVAYPDMVKALERLRYNKQKNKFDFKLLEIMRNFQT